MTDQLPARSNMLPVMTSIQPCSGFLRTSINQIANLKSSIFNLKFREGR